MESALVGLHDINGRALWVISGLRVFSAPITDGDSVDTGNAAAVHIAEVNLVRDCATSNLWLPSIVSAVVRVALQPHRVVVRDCDAGICLVNVEGRPLLRATKSPYFTLINLDVEVEIAD